MQYFTASLDGTDVMVFNMQKVDANSSSSTLDTATFELFGQEFKVENKPLGSPDIPVSSNRKGIPLFKKVPSQPSELDVNEEHLEEIAADVLKYQRYSLCGFRIGKRLATGLLWSGVVLGHVGQNVALPSFADNLCLNCMTSTYFVALFTACASVLILSPFFLVCLISRTNTPVQHHSHSSLAVVGFLSACALLIRAYTAPSSKVSPVFQAIASSVSICYSIRLHTLFKEEYLTSKDAITCLLVVFGLLLAMIPTWNDPLCGIDRGVVWPLICLFGWLPKTLLNVLEEWQFVGVCQSDGWPLPQPPANTLPNIISLLFWVNLYALFFLVAFFWTDMLPVPLGLGSNFAEFLSMIRESLYCYAFSRPQCPHLAFWATFHVLTVLWTSVCCALVQEQVFAKLSMAAALVYVPLSVLAWMGYYLRLSSWQAVVPTLMVYMCALVPILTAVAMHGLTRASASFAVGQTTIGCLDRAMTDDRYLHT
eukprot:EG_transcript_7539